MAERARASREAAAVRRRLTPHTAAVRRSSSSAPSPWRPSWPSSLLPAWRPSARAPVVTPWRDVGELVRRDPRRRLASLAAPPPALAERRRGHRDLGAHHRAPELDRRRHQWSFNSPRPDAMSNGWTSTRVGLILTFTGAILTNRTVAARSLRGGTHLSFNMRNSIGLFREIAKPERRAEESRRSAAQGTLPGQDKGDSTSLQLDCSARARSRPNVHASKTFREMIPRPKVSQNEWKTTEI